MTGNTQYQEKLSSTRTEALFLGLMVLFSLLLIWRWRIARLDALGIIFLCLAVLFLFYSLNYLTLHIRLTRLSLELKFGIITWRIPFDKIENCRLDDNLPVLMKYGGAGFHFITIDHRYRASLNFLEYPRVVISLKKKAGLVKDISFSTRKPEEVILLIQGHLLVDDLQKTIASP